MRQNWRNRVIGLICLRKRLDPPDYCAARSGYDNAWSGHRNDSVPFSRRRSKVRRTTQNPPGAVPDLTESFHKGAPPGACWPGAEELSK